jgi:hypothetical protein
MNYIYGAPEKSVKEANPLNKSWNQNSITLGQEHPFSQRHNMNNQASMEHLQQLNVSKDKLNRNSQGEILQHKRKNSEALNHNTKRFL